MSGRTLALIILRALAIWLAAAALSGIGPLFQSWGEGELVRQAKLATTGIWALLPLVVSWLVWAAAPWLAARFLPAAFEVGIAGVSEQAALRIAVAVVGLWTLAEVLPNVAWYAYMDIQLSTYQKTAAGTLSAPVDLQREYWKLEGIADQVAIVVRLLFGVICLVRPATVAGTIGMLDERSRDTSESEGEDQGATS